MLDKHLVCQKHLELDC